MYNLFHWVLQALRSWAPPFVLVFSVFNQFCFSGWSLRLSPGWEAAWALLPNLNAHIPHATAPERNCRFYNIPPLSQFIWEYSLRFFKVVEFKEKLLPWVNQWLHLQQHKQTIIRRQIQSLVTFYRFLLTCLLITSPLHGKACLSGWQNTL